MSKMDPRSCPACGRPQGTNARCLSCRDAAARELASEARDVTPVAVSERLGSLGDFLRRPPWYTRAAPGRLLERIRLLFMVLRDYANGSYRKMPWKAVAAVVAASFYVVSPVDLIPDFMIPVGWTDDLLVVVMAWGLLKRELRDYCAWKGLAPSHFGL